MKSPTLILLLGLAFAGTASHAQMPGIPGIPGLKGGGLPDISSISQGNAAGVLGYCLKNKLLGGSDASSVIDTLTGKPEVKSSEDFTAGQAGQLNLGGGSSFSLDSVQGGMKKQACDMVLKQAKNFL